MLLLLPLPLPLPLLLLLLSPRLQFGGSILGFGVNVGLPKAETENNICNQNWQMS